MVLGSSHTVILYVARNLIMVSVSAVILNIAQCEGAGGDRKSHGGCLSTDLVILDTGTLLRPSVVLRGESA